MKRRKTTKTTQNTKTKTNYWVKSFDGVDYVSYVCSACGHRHDVNCASDIEEYKYCYHCGKKLTGVKEKA